MQWFTHDRFGMFIHWGLYAIPARGEWVRSTEEIPEEDAEREKTGKQKNMETCEQLSLFDFIQEKTT